MTSWHFINKCFFFSNLSKLVCFHFSDEQFILKRVADCAIDIYAMVVVLSRYAKVQTTDLSLRSFFFFPLTTPSFLSVPVALFLHAPTHLLN